MDRGRRPLSIGRRVAVDEGADEGEAEGEVGPLPKEILKQMIGELEKLDPFDARRVTAALAAWFDVDDFDGEED